MFVLKTAKTVEIYRNCLNSVLKYDLILKCFMSKDSNNMHDILHYLKKKTSPVQEKRNKQMKTAKQVFELLKGDDDELKKDEAVKNLKPEELSSKINELIKTAEAVPITSPDTLPIAKAEKAPRDHGNDYKKKEFLAKAKQVALALGVDVEMTQKELLEAFESVKDNTPLSSIEPQQFSKINFVKKVEMEHFRSSGLKIFKESVRKQETEPILETWNKLKQITLLHASSRPPRNYFDELINWTNHGKLWRFPIDNDQDWKEELATDFTEHIFLDKHLESWCPKTGPIRHFMELVTTGLSKNPYLSAEKKKQHLLWYKNYFESKSSLLAELGVVDAKSDVQAEKLEAGKNMS